MPRLTYDQAHAMVAASTAKAREIGVPMSTAVVDAGGRLIAFGRMDGAAWATVDIAIAMAETVTAFGYPGQSMKRVENDHWFRGVPLTGGRRALAGEAGMPIRIDGELVGAIGVSGGSGQQDRACAIAALAAIGIAPET
ncbi:MAG: heme-binding protein [Dehalococcoidia bacterium]|nr:heme-binding protein [Dehalococcoidia bacterium]